MSQRIKHTLCSKYYKIPTRLGTLHVHVDFDDKGIKRVFSQIPPVGSDTANTTALIGILLTKYFGAGGQPKDILKHLFSVKGQSIGTWEGQTIDSIPQAIGMALNAFLDHDKTNDAVKF